MSDSAEQFEFEDVEEIKPPTARSLRKVDRDTPHDVVAFKISSYATSTIFILILGILTLGWVGYHLVAPVYGLPMMDTTQEELFPILGFSLGLFQMFLSLFLLRSQTKQDERNRIIDDRDREESKGHDEYAAEMLRYLSDVVDSINTITGSMKARQGAIVAKEEMTQKSLSNLNEFVVDVTKGLAVKVATSPCMLILARHSALSEEELLEIIKSAGEKYDEMTEVKSASLKSEKS